MRLQEHGFKNNFKSMTECTVKNRTSIMQSNIREENNLVAAAGGFQEIQIHLFGRNGMRNGRIHCGVFLQEKFCIKNCIFRQWIWIFKT